MTLSGNSIDNKLEQLLNEFGPIDIKFPVKIIELKLIQHVKQFVGILSTFFGIFIDFKHIHCSKQLSSIVIKLSGN